MQLTQEHQKVFNFLRDVHEACQSDQTFSLDSKLHKYGVYNTEFRKALHRSGLLQKKGRDGVKIVWDWDGSVPPNIQTASRLVDEWKQVKKKDKKQSDDKPTTKKCTKCGKVKELDAFYYDSKSKDNRTSQCKECMRAAARARQNATKKQETEKQAVEHKPEPKKQSNYFVVKINKHHIMQMIRITSYLLAGVIGYLISFIKF